MEDHPRPHISRGLEQGSTRSVDRTVILSEAKDLCTLRRSHKSASAHLFDRQICPCSFTCNCEPATPSAAPSKSGRATIASMFSTDKLAPGHSAQRLCTRSVHLQHPGRAALQEPRAASWKSGALAPRLGPIK